MTRFIYFIGKQGTRQQMAKRKSLDLMASVGLVSLPPLSLSHCSALLVEQALPINYNYLSLNWFLMKCSKLN